MPDSTQNPQDWFPGLGGAAQGGGGNYINGGCYDLEILALTRKVSADPAKRKARMIVCEARVEKVLLAYPAETHLGKPFPASNREGETVSVLINLDGEYPSLEMGKLKGILEAALGPADDALCASFEVPVGADPWSVIAAQVTEPPGHALAGSRIRCTATRKLTKIKCTPIAELRFSATPTAA